MNNRIVAYTVKSVQKADYKQVIDFVMKMRMELFPMLNNDHLPPDLLHFDEFYIKNEKANFFAVYNEDNQVIGSIGVSPYDHRFEDFQSIPNAAEIVKCYIDPGYRRLGIGTLLLKEAADFSRNAGYQTLYLHTHPFLPGALPFWKSQGYKEFYVDEDPVWNTIHMSKEL